MLFALRAVVRNIVRKSRKCPFCPAGAPLPTRSWSKCRRDQLTFIEDGLSAASERPFSMKVMPRRNRSSRAGNRCVAETEWHHPGRKACAANSITRHWCLGILFSLLGVLYGFRRRLVLAVRLVRCTYIWWDVRPESVRLCRRWPALHLQVVQSVPVGGDGHGHFTLSGRLGLEGSPREVIYLARP